MKLIINKVLGMTFMDLKHFGFVLLMAAVMVGCGKEAKEQFLLEREMQLDNVSGIGFVKTNEGIWIADGDNNRLVLINELGRNVKIEEGFERPMHIDAKNGIIYVPEYGSDSIRILMKGKRASFNIHSELDAPAGITLSGNDYAVADFYGHRIVAKLNNKDIIIGKKGHDKGELHYPTDVQIVGDSLYVADAYNNRVQLFDFEGRHLQTIGENSAMNASTGIFVDDKNVYVTDFENERVLIYNKNGELLKIIAEGLSKPVDLMINEGELWVLNYGGKSISIFK